MLFYIHLISVLISFKIKFLLLKICRLLELITLSYLVQSIHKVTLLIFINVLHSTVTCCLNLCFSKSSLSILSILTSLKLQYHRTFGYFLAVSKAKRGFSLDLLLATAEDLEKYRDAWATLYPKVLREGRVLYAP